MGSPEVVPSEPRVYEKGEVFFVTAEYAFMGRGSCPHRVLRGTKIRINEEDAGGSALFCHVESFLSGGAVSPFDVYVQRNTLNGCRKGQERHADTPLSPERTQALREPGLVDVRGTDTPQEVVDLTRRAFDESGRE